jgi:hypothetical protein
MPSGFTHPTLTGEGAFSSVYRVRQTSLDRWVAIKMITERDKDRRSELLLEAKTQANIHLDCIPQIYDTFEWDKRICIIMQWIKGVSLRNILDNNPPLVQRHYIANYLIKTIAALHDQGFAHRDLKPENVLISPESGLFLVDFGFTKSVNDGRKSVSGIIKGTPAYMAPELWNFSSAVNPLRTDLYSLGKILKELIPPDKRLYDIINPLLDDNPNNRPESARSLYDEWASATRAESAGTGWKQISGFSSSQDLSRKLLTASRELLFANRYDESYWLLVECLEEDPEYADAIEYMSKFPKSLKNHRIRIMTTASVAIGILTIIIAFFAGKLTSREIIIEQAEPTHVYADKYRKLQLPKASVRTPEQAFLREDTSGSKNLNGRIYLTAIPAGGSILLDSIKIDIQTVENGISTFYGNHVLQYINSSGQVLWKEKFNLLPFQKKYFSIQ